ncbi:MAG: hypothetical protein WCG80_17325 [Spirochaetales bacterium]
MSDLKSGVILLENEKMVMEIEAELWATSNNPIARAFGGLSKFISMLLGTRLEGYLVITDKRVIEVKTTIQCYCFTTGREVKYVMPSSVKEIGYQRSASFMCCCPTFYMYYEAYTQRTRIQMKTSTEAEVAKAVDSFYFALQAK